MKATLPPLNQRRIIRFSTVLCLVAGFLPAMDLHAQTPEEHASHHPAAAGAAAMPAAPGAAPAMGAMPATVGGPAPGGMGGMMGGMGEMMEGMGKPAPKELYPSLMALPELTSEQRQQVGAQADERMHTGSVLMGQALDSLNAGTQSGDYAAMHEAMSRLREGAAQLDSGIAARRALVEGRAPRSVALAWFKQEMNLPPATAPVQRAGSSPFHIFTMVLLVVFALAMVAMYFFKMRRAAALFGRIEADKQSPPPGSAPELSGGKPPDGKNPGANNKAIPADPPAVPADKPAAAAKPAAADKPAADDKPDAPADKPVATGKPLSGDQSAGAAADKLASAADKLASAADKLAAASDKLAAAASQPPSAGNSTARDKGATGGKTPPPAALPAADTKSAPQEGPAATKLTCLAPEARAVFLVGTFNGWDAKATPMIKDAEGNWSVALALPPGHQEFKFVVDGVLCCEPGCEGPHEGCPKCVPNSSGTMNRFIEVTKS